MKGHATTINIGKICGGDWSSTVPCLVQLEGRVGWPPGETVEDIKKKIEKTVRDVCRRDSWLRNNPAVVEWFGWRAEPSEQDTHPPMVQTIAKNIKEITGNIPTFTGGSAGLDTRFFILYGVCQLLLLALALTILMGRTNMLS
jgi:acetylornithine deacetylase